MLLGDPLRRKYDGFWDMVDWALENDAGLWLSVFGDKNKFVVHDGLARISLYDVIEFMAQGEKRIPLAINLDYGIYNPESKPAATEIIKMFEKYGVGIEYTPFCANRDTLSFMKRNYPRVETGIMCTSIHDIKDIQALIESGELGCKHLALSTDFDDILFIVDLNEKLAKSNVDLRVITNNQILYAALLNKAGIGVTSWDPEEVVAARKI
jgi:hypothetical protein